MEKIQITNHPELPEVERFFEFKEIKTDLENYAEIVGFIKYQRENKTPKGFNINGDFIVLRADNTTLVNVKNGEYIFLLEETGTEKERAEIRKQNNEMLSNAVGELDYIKNMDINLILQEEETNIKLQDIFQRLIFSSIQKQDNYLRFNK